MKFINEFDSAEFARRLKTKRIIDLDIDMRTMSEQAKVSISTISRIENGMSPDLPNFIKICNWLQENPCNFFKIIEVKAKRKAKAS